MSRVVKGDDELYDKVDEAAEALWDILIDSGLLAHDKALVTFNALVLVVCSIGIAVEANKDHLISVIRDHYKNSEKAEETVDTPQLDGTMN